ncbi:CAF1 family ribonuclease domain-containing protein [Purpureocillium lavendulum]|uniref:CAF1 family ribonuclease domain-containing protein n=1 Tax=Purpureocillium lavendulum TaxID=1247861 RepID=A0AB34G4N4_9HYPO|nr:CAF1 family ribonuclease domain-containing protein [Purpureocillium lavendulum]
MDVTADNFWQLLPSMLEAIAAADYVAIDLEMTGVVVRDSASRGKMSLEQAYNRVRNAASTFSAVELGVTTMRFMNSSYQTQTFTVPISTIVPRETREDAQLAKLLDRKLTLSSNSLRFLVEHGFDMERALGGGVPYLSREELELVQQRFLGGGGVDCEKVDLAALSEFEAFFCGKLRTTLKEWLACAPKPGNVLEVPEPRGANLRRSTIALVNRIVADEFPQCRCWRQRTGDAMSIAVRDMEKSAEIEMRENRAKGACLAKNFGMSWIVEALIGFDGTSGYEAMASIVREKIAPSEDGQEEADQQKWHQLITKLGARPNNRVLVGHNLVWDLAFLYSMFIGPLPPTVGEFSATIRLTFPRVIDTKLFLHLAVDPNVVDETLEEVFLGLQRQAYPFIEAASDEWAFAQTGDNKGAAHRAGYDSYMTAVVFLKLCCRRTRVVKRALAAKRAGQQTATDPFAMLTATSWVDVVDDQLSAMDKFLKGDDIVIPSFDGDFFMLVRNRLRMSCAGVLVLNHVPPTIPSPRKRKPSSMAAAAAAAAAASSATAAAGRGASERGDNNNNNDDDDDVFAAKTPKAVHKPSDEEAALEMWGVIKGDLCDFMNAIYNFNNKLGQLGAMEEFRGLLDKLDKGMEDTRGKIGSYLAEARNM